ncbi:hypothetical protein P0082_00685 [Candidatus Haliotispira prima]|uniref:UPF0102 protein P0082_00685 n=1 Tax=Candidatus Haliotispira prima TaxID=3034016 RepID=A0ABY8MHI2_9SPIO|nr:hypothetical protein P0082_00685 [Candidatus Haliotispira prima]
MGFVYDRGRAGEDTALRYFLDSGYCLLKRNFRARADQPLSEIDLIFLALQANAPESFRQDFLATVSDFRSREGMEQRPEQAKDFIQVVGNFVTEGESCLSIVFVEVKSWHAYPTADLCYNLNIGRQKRMFQTAECFLQRNPTYALLSRRFDLVVFRGLGSEPHHIEAAFP